MVTKNLQTNETIKFLFGEMNSLRENTYQTFCGTIHYWSSILSKDAITLIFLPGLTADHRLFDKQVECFEGKYNIIVWDAPAHASSWPFRFDFDLFDKAKWLNGILEKEEIAKPVIVVNGRILGTGLCTSLSESTGRIYFH